VFETLSQMVIADRR